MRTISASLRAFSIWSAMCSMANASNVSLAAVTSFSSSISPGSVKHFSSVNMVRLRSTRPLVLVGIPVEDELPAPSPLPAPPEPPILPAPPAPFFFGLSLTSMYLRLPIQMGSMNIPSASMGDTKSIFSNLNTPFDPSKCSECQDSLMLRMYLSSGLTKSSLPESSSESGIFFPSIRYLCLQSITFMAQNAASIINVDVTSFSLKNVLVNFFSRGPAGVAASLSFSESSEMLSQNSAMPSSLSRPRTFSLVLSIKRRTIPSMFDR